MAGKLTMHQRWLLSDLWNEGAQYVRGSYATAAALERKGFAQWVSGDRMQITPLGRQTFEGMADRRALAAKESADG